MSAIDRFNHSTLAQQSSEVSPLSTPPFSSSYTLSLRLSPMPLPTRPPINPLASTTLFPFFSHPVNPFIHTSPLSPPPILFPPLHLVPHPSSFNHPSQPLPFPSIEHSVKNLNIFPLFRLLSRTASLRPLIAAPLAFLPPPPFSPQPSLFPLF